MLVDVKNDFTKLNKIVNEIKKYGETIKRGDMDENVWRQNKSSILKNVNNYDKVVMTVTKTLGYLKGLRVEEPLQSKIKETIDTIKPKLDDFEEKIPKHIYAIKKFGEEQGGDDEKNENLLPDNNKEGNQLMVIQIDNSDQYLKQRKEQLQNIYKISAEMKELSDEMAIEVQHQGDLLDNVQEHVEQANVNAEKAEDEIKAADEMSKKNRKKMCCLIVIVSVVVCALLAILLSVFLKKKK